MVWVRLTYVKVHPDKVDEVKKIYYEEIVPTVKAKVKGLIDVFLLEPTDEEDEFISFARFESKADGEAYEASGTYKEMVDKLRHMFAGSPTLKSYEVTK